MREFILSVASSLVATALIWYVKHPRVGPREDLGGIWIEMVYASQDWTFEGPIQRIDVVRTHESLRKVRVRGVIYRIFDNREADGLPELRSYRFRGRLSSGAECVHYWHVKGHGSDGVWLMVHNRDEKKGEYVRRNPAQEALERFPLRHLRPDSSRLKQILLLGGVVPGQLKGSDAWPNWVKRQYKWIESLD
jgi:hypothetical protein